MKREELEALGLSKEQIDKVLDAHHKELDPVQKDLAKAQDDLKAEQEKTSVQKTTIDELNKSLDGFKDVDVSALKQQITKLEGDIKAKDEEHSKAIADRDFQDILKESIASAKGKNAKAITALLDIDALKASKNQKDDIAAALKKLAEAEDSKMLFGEPEPTHVGDGDPIGVVNKGPTNNNETLRGALAEKYSKQ